MVRPIFASRNPRGLRGDKSHHADVGVVRRPARCRRCQGSFSPKASSFRRCASCATAKSSTKRSVFFAPTHERRTPAAAISRRANRGEFVGERRSPELCERYGRDNIRRGGGARARRERARDARGAAIDRRRRLLRLGQSRGSRWCAEHPDRAAARAARRAGAVRLRRHLRAGRRSAQRRLRRDASGVHDACAPSRIRRSR